MIFVKRQIVMFWIQCCCFFSSEGSSQSIQPDTFPTLNCNKVNTFWPPWFLCYHLFAVWSSCPIHSLNLWLGSSSLFSPEKFSVHCLSVFPRFLIFSPLSWDTKCHFQLSKKKSGQAEPLAKPQFVHSPPLSCIEITDNQIGMLTNKLLKSKIILGTSKWAGIAQLTLTMCLSKQTVSNAYLLNALSVWHKISAFSYNIKLL